MVILFSEFKKNNLLDEIKSNKLIEKAKEEM